MLSGRSTWCKEVLPDVFSCNPVTLYQRKIYKSKIPRKNQHWVYFYHSNLKVGPFGPPPVALGLRKVIHGVRKVYLGVWKVYHGVRKVYHGARKIYNGVRKVYHGVS